MKRFAEIVLAVTMMTLLVGCVIGHDRATDEAVELRLRAVMSQSTRSEAPDVTPHEGEYGFPTTFPANTNLGVWAFSLPRDKKWAVFNPDAKSFVTNEMFVRDAESGLWCPTTRLDWVYSQSLTLIGYAPYELDMEYDVERGLMLRNYDTTNQSEVVDILYTDYIADCHSEKNLRFVNMPFYHALAKVDLEAHTALGDDYIFTIRKITFESLATQGTFYSHPLPEWVAKNRDGSVVVYDSEEGWELLSHNDHHIEGSETILIPQQMDGSVVIEAGVEHAGFVTSYTYRVPLKTLWEAGKYYTYTLNFTSEGVTIREPFDLGE